MITPTQCFTKYGAATDRNPHLALWVLPDDLKPHFAHVKIYGSDTPGLKRVYGNKDLFVPLEKGLRNLVEAGKEKELRTWDGVFCIRKMRGANIMSLHSWGVAFDVNAAENPMGKTPVLSKEFVKAFKMAGFDWGGDFAGTRVDGMHFQLKNLP